MITLACIIFTLVIIAICILATIVGGLTEIILLPFECIFSKFKNKKSHRKEK